MIFELTVVGIRPLSIDDGLHLGIFNCLCCSGDCGGAAQLLREFLPHFAQHRGRCC